MENKRYKVRLNSLEKIEDLLQEIYDQACKQINEIENETSKLMSSVNLGKEEVTMEDKARYAKAIHDYLEDKRKAINTKLDVAKFMGEIVKHQGDVGEALNNKEFKKRTSLNLEELQAVMNDTDDTDTYNLKGNN